MVTLREIMLAAQIVSGLSRDTIRAGAGNRGYDALVGYPARVAIGLVARAAGHPLKSIARCIDRDHTTVIHNTATSPRRALKRPALGQEQGARLAEQMRALLASAEWPIIARGEASSMARRRSQTTASTPGALA